MKTTKILSLGCAVRIQFDGECYSVEQAPLFADNSIDEDNWAIFENGPGEPVSVFQEESAAVEFIAALRE